MLSKFTESIVYFGQVILKNQLAKTASITLPSTSPVMREPTRPLAARPDDFDTKFDRDTLIYDAVIDRNAGLVRLIAPPFFNLSPAIEQAHIRSQPGTRPCSFRVRNLDRLTLVEVDVPLDCASLILNGAFGDFAIALNEQSDILSGERVLLTLSKNNRLTWIKDWIRFNRDIHGTTAVLIYDNASSEYTTTELREAIESVGGLNAVVVVEWPFKHGPTGFDQRSYWDSNFSQLGALEDARWRFLQSARSVLNSDIDELVMSRNGCSVFEAVERSRIGTVAFYGDWVFGIEAMTRSGTADDVVRFRDFRHVLAVQREMKWGVLPRYPMRCRAKWAIVPERCPAKAQWHVHSISGWPISRVTCPNFRFRHFREINFNWKYDRVGRQSFDPNKHLEDDLMLRTFSRVYWDR